MKSIKIFSVISAFADFERDLIVERTKEGKEIAKQNPNFKDGRPLSIASKK
ncbi:recombinase family protein [Aerococcus urinaeequi]|uniref:recombinase family protein n=1 Tax=Aerococcus urinaeequi TaxID=51665 RepID=UPI003D6B2FE5